jgi:hypothetical protein
VQNGLPLLLIVLLNAGVVWADAIRYDQIPADVSSYVNVDVDRLASSFFLAPPFATKPSGGSQDAAAMVEAIFGDQVASITVYSVGDSKLVALLHAKEKVRERWEAKAATARDAYLFSYDGQDIHYTSDNSWISDDVAAAFGAVRHRGISQPPEPIVQPHASFGIGLGREDPLEIQRLMLGPVYTAFIGQDFAIATTDLPSMAHALDVLHDKKPSLAKQDPQGLKADVPPGVIFQGAGLTAELNADNLSHQGEKTVAENGGSGFGFDLFGSFKGKARLARFDMGQDDHDLYLDASLAMINADSAEQLKNLILGIKALISLSAADRKPLIDVLQIQTAGADVVLHWKWPTTNLAELFRLTQERSDYAKPLPATNPVEPRSSPLPGAAH